MHFPAGWEAANLPGLTRLKANGVSFSRTITNACMCSSARATLLTGFLPAQVRGGWGTALCEGDNPAHGLPAGTGKGAGGVQPCVKGTTLITGFLPAQVRREGEPHCSRASCRQR